MPPLCPQGTIHLWDLLAASVAFNLDPTGVDFDLHVNSTGLEAVLTEVVAQLEQKLKVCACGRMLVCVGGGGGSRIQGLRVGAVLTEVVAQLVKKLKVGGACFGLGFGVRGGALAGGGCSRGWVAILERKLGAGARAPVEGLGFGVARWGSSS